MARKRIAGKLYLIERIVYDKKTHRHYLERSEDGTLFTGVREQKTNLLPEDLPEHFLFGRFHKRFGYMCTKGIVDLKYHPTYWTDHFLKDDYLLISYNKPICLKDEFKDAKHISAWDGYENVDERVYGREIITVLEGARKYSGFDIAPILEQLHKKLDWCIEEYGPEHYEGWRKNLKELEG